MQITVTHTINREGQVRCIHMTSGALVVRLVRSPQSPLWAFESYDADVDDVPVKGGLFALPTALTQAHVFFGLQP